MLLIRENLIAAKRDGEITRYCIYKDSAVAVEYTERLPQNGVNPKPKGMVFIGWEGQETDLLTTHASDDYKHYIEELKTTTVTPTVDCAIAKTLLNQGHDAKAVQVALQQSPCAPTRTDEARKYGQAIIRDAEKELQRAAPKKQGASRKV